MVYKFQITKCNTCGYQTHAKRGDKICPDCGKELEEVLECITSELVLPDNSTTEEVFWRFNDLGVDNDFWFATREIKEFEDRWNVPALCNSSTVVKYVTLYKKSFVENYAKGSKHVH